MSDQLFQAMLDQVDGAALEVAAAFEQVAGSAAGEFAGAARAAALELRRIVADRRAEPRGAARAGRRRDDPAAP